ncbi:MAG TPA: ribosomal protein S18-alanine N-acetyltransferase [Longimicrobiales bacterium]|nr:ribosomal protein S18-alanine N-acetyltransferase [Longimicrobiales bacterium]
MGEVGAPSGVRVRAMRRDDLDAVAALERATFSSPWHRETFAGLVGRPTVEALVLESDEGGVIGYAILWCVLEEGELANLAVAPRLQGRGLGGQLLAAAMERARERGVERVYLEVRETNAHAIALYRRFGFVEVGRRRDYYERPREDALLMRAELASAG